MVRRMVPTPIAQVSTLCVRSLFLLHQEMNGVVLLQTRLPDSHNETRRQILLAVGEFWWFVYRIPDHPEGSTKGRGYPYVKENDLELKRGPDGVCSGYKEKVSRIRKRLSDFKLGSHTGLTNGLCWLTVVP